MVSLLIYNKQRRDTYDSGSIEGSLSRCATYTWPELSAESYYCETSPVTETVFTTTKTEMSSNAGQPTESGSHDDGSGGGIGSEGGKSTLNDEYATTKSR